MAFRIHESVIRGEVDNRVKGTVSGRIWIEGRSEPLILDLSGNAHPDLAGCLLTFTNPTERIAHRHLDSLHSIQRGTAGDLTASRKVRVFDVPLEDAMAMLRRKETPPEHLANCMYLEWFSEANGRVVIESHEYEVAISTPLWRLTPEEDAERAWQAARGMEDFMRRLTEAIDKQQRSQKSPEDDWDEHDYEKFLTESDARTEKYMELIDKYGDSDEARRKIDHEMGWDEELTPEQQEEENARIEEINRACDEALDEPRPEPDPATEGIDWIRIENGNIVHPLQHRCAESALKYWHLADDLGLDKLADKDLEQFIFEFQTTAAKLAGALNSIAEDRCPPDSAFTVAYLKRALDHLHKAQAGLEAIVPKGLLPEDAILDARRELFEIREAILKLMDAFRGRT